MEQTFDLYFKFNIFQPFVGQMSENTCFFRHLTDKWVPANKMLLAGRVPENYVFLPEGFRQIRCYLLEGFRKMMCVFARGVPLSKMLYV